MFDVGRIRSGPIQMSEKIAAVFPEGESLSFWLNEPIGELISKDRAGRELRRIKQGERVFFLKRSGKESLARHMRMLAFGHRPKCGALREVELLLSLKSAGFAAMEPVAWGQRREGGLFASGFLLIRNVEGREATNLFTNGTHEERKKLMYDIGELLGALHAKGFYQSVRMKDLIFSDGQLVLIDRETSKPWCSLFRKRKCVSIVMRGIRRTAKDGYKFSTSDMRRFTNGYVRGVSSRWEVAPSRLMRLLSEEARLQ